MSTIKLTILFPVMIFLSGITNAQTKTFKINSTSSSIEWTGKKVLGQHNGTVNISDGQLILKGSVLTGGNFTIDLTSIKDKDLTNEDFNKKLIGHLKSPDFFNVAKYPAASFKITKVEKYKTTDGKYKLTGDLTIKDITNPVTFDAVLTPNGTKYTGTAHVVIDRTKWDIKYGSSSFFENIGDKAISNDIELNVTLDAN